MYNRGSVLDLLIKAIKKGLVLSEATKKYLSFQVIKGILSMHYQGMAHLDIKPDNIMLTDTLGLDFIDLASAKPAHVP